RTWAAVHGGVASLRIEFVDDLNQYSIPRIPPCNAINHGGVTAALAAPHSRGANHGRSRQWIWARTLHVEREHRVSRAWPGARAGVRQLDDRQPRHPGHRRTTDGERQRSRHHEDLQLAGPG